MALLEARSRGGSTAKGAMIRPRGDVMDRRSLGLVLWGGGGGGFYASDDATCYNEACKLARKVNITLLDREPKKVVVYLDPHEFQSTWLGNKSVYRTRMAIADGGELIVLAPALKEFGEDPTIDKLIRKFGYNGTPATLQAVEDDDELRGNLSAAAHLIHGSSEGRFNITYCPGEGGVTLDEIRSVGFTAAPYEEMTPRQFGRSFDRNSCRCSRFACTGIT